MGETRLTALPKCGDGFFMINNPPKPFRKASVETATAAKRFRFTGQFEFEFYWPCHHYFLILVFVQ